MVLRRLGQTAFAHGDFAGARKAFEQGLAIDRQRATASPNVPETQGELAFSLNSLGGTLAAQKDVAAALKAYQEAAAIDQKLASADPASIQRQGAAVVDDLRLGDMALGQGDAAGAQKSYELALVTLRPVAAAHPAATGPARMVAIVMVKLASTPASGVHWADVVAYLEGLKAKNMLLAGDAKWLDVYRQKATQEAGK